MCVIQQVEPEAHAGEKTTFDSFSDHIAILQRTCVKDIGQNRIE